MKNENNLRASFTFVLAVFIVILVGVALFYRPEEEGNSARKVIPSSKRADFHPVGYQDIAEKVQIRRQAVEQEEERKRREEWIKNFPYSPIQHPTVRYNPDIYNQTDPGLNRNQGNMEYEKQRKLVMDHGYLKAFFENDSRYSKEFQQVYKILKEYDRADNPMNVGDIFSNLMDYHKAQGKNPAALLDYERYDLENLDENGHPRLVRVAVDGQTTWGEWTEKLRESIMTTLISPRLNLTIDEASLDFATEITDRLINEIPANGFLSGLEDITNARDETLQAGDPLLVPWESYIDDYFDWESRFYTKMAEEKLKTVPQVLKLGEDGRVYDPATGKEFRPGADISLIKNGQVVESFEN